MVREKDERWDVLRSLLDEAGMSANLTTDAHLAALAITHGAVLVSCDTDFARFRGLRWETPPPVNPHRALRVDQRAPRTVLSQAATARISSMVTACGIGYSPHCTA